MSVSFLMLSPPVLTISFTGTLTPTAEMAKSPAAPVVPLILTQERPLKTQTSPQEVTSAIRLPSVLTMPLPAVAGDLGQVQRSYVLELRSAAGQVWQQPLPAKNSVFEYENRRYTINASPGDNEVRIELIAGGTGLTSREK